MTTPSAPPDQTSFEGHPEKPVAENNVVDPNAKLRENPVRFRWAQLILRSLSLVYSIGCFAAVIYLFARYPNQSGRYGVGISATIVALWVDAYEVFRLIGKGYTQPRAMSINACAVVEDVLVLGLALPGWISMNWNIAPDNFSPSTDVMPDYVRPIENISLFLIPLAAIHGFWSLLGCIGYCVVQCAPKRPQKVVVVYVPVPGPAAPPDASQQV